MIKIHMHWLELIMWLTILIIVNNISRKCFDHWWRWYRDRHKRRYKDAEDGM